eukprot:479269-Hanusia_phi.AAC.3
MRGGGLCNGLDFTRVVKHVFSPSQLCSANLALWKSPYYKDHTNRKQLPLGGGKWARPANDFRVEPARVCCRRASKETIKSRAGGEVCRGCSKTHTDFLQEGANRDDGMGGGAKVRQRCRTAIDRFRNTRYSLVRVGVFLRGNRGWSPLYATPNQCHHQWKRSDFTSFGVF